MFGPISHRSIVPQLLIRICASSFRRMTSRRMRPATSFAPFDAQCDALQIRTWRLVQYIVLPSGFGGGTRPPADVVELETGDHARAAGNTAALVDFQATVRPRLQRVSGTRADALVPATVQADVAIV